MSDYRNKTNLDYRLVSDSSRRIKAHHVLITCVERDILPGTGVSSEKFWSLINSVIERFTARKFGSVKVPGHSTKGNR